MDADFPRIHPRESALIGGFIPFSITHASRGKLDRFVNFVGTKWTYIVSQKGRVRIMIFGMTTFSIVHVVLSLIGIFSGFVVVFGLLTAKRLDSWTALFLMSTVATSVTGFLFPFDRFLPSHAVGILSLIVLAVALRALPGWRLAVGLRGHRCNSPLSQCLRLDCAAFSESAGPESDRSDAIRVTIRARADRRSVAFCRSCHCGGAQISQLAASHM